MTPMELELLEALKGVVRVADRKTDEFDAARAAIAKAEGEQKHAAMDQMQAALVRGNHRP